MKIIACLGNPGRKYRKNRHNAGFMAGFCISGKYGIPAKKKMFSSICGTGNIKGIDVLLLFPDTFMNKSGIAVNAALQYYGENPNNLIVIHDEIELPFGQIKAKFGGGHKGHNGIRSISQVIGSSDFHRIRIGVGRPENPEMEVADYLLSDFGKEEMESIDKLAEEAAELAVSIIKSEHSNIP